MASEIAGRYGEAVFELASENGTVQDKKKQALSLLDILSKEGDLMRFLNAVKITAEEKKRVVGEIFADYLDRDMIHLIDLLIDKGRIGHLKEVLAQYARLADESLGIITGTVYSARPLSGEDLDKIAAALAKQSGKKVALENKIDTGLIAGIKVTVGNRVTDITVKRQMDEMRTAILKGGSA